MKHLLVVVFLLVSVTGQAHPGKRLTFEASGTGEDCKWACGRARTNTYFQYVLKCNPKHHTWSDVNVKTECWEEIGSGFEDTFQCERIETGLCHHDNHN